MVPRINFLKRFSVKYVVLLDQSLLSIINFGSILFLSKIVNIASFGDFVITYSYSYFIFIFATYFLSSPMLVFLSKKWMTSESNYLVVCTGANFIINFFFSSILFYFLSKQVDTIFYFPFLLLGFSMSLFDILKKFIFSSRNIHVKYGLYATLLLNVLFFGQLFYNKNDLDINSISMIYVISFCSGAFLIVIFLIYKGIFSNNFKLPHLGFLTNVIYTHFHYSKWIILGGIAFWGYSQGIYILAKIYLIDDFTIGKVRTIQNLLGVFSILLISLENHYTPIFAQQSLQGNIIDLEYQIKNIFRKNYIKFIFLFTIAIPIGLMFYNYIYFEKYGSGIIIFLIFLSIQALLLFIRPFGIALKSIEKTLPFFISHVLAVAALFLAVPFFLAIESNYTIAFSIIIANVVYVAYIAIYYVIKRQDFLKQKM